MLKRKMVCAAIAAIVASVTVSASAAVNTMYDSLNKADSLASEWNNPNSLSMVKTDLMPSGYAVKGGTDIEKNIWISSKTTSTFSDANKYYMSYYINTADFISASKTTSQYFHVGIYNGNTPLLRTGIHPTDNKVMVDKQQLSWSVKVDSAPEDRKTYQVVTRMWKSDANMVAQLYLYDVESGKLIGQTSMLNGSNSSFNNFPGTGRSIKVGCMGALPGTQYISDFKMIEADSADYNYVTNLVHYDMPKVDFSEIQSQLNVSDVDGSYEIPVSKDSITFPEEAIINNSSTVTYSCSDSTVIDEKGNVKHGIADKRVFIIATLENRGATMERALAITVKGTGTEAVASEDWRDAGETISGYDPTENGFEDSWKVADGDIAADSEAPVKTLGDKKLVYIEGKNNSADTRTETYLYNKFNKKVDMNADATYYLSYVMDFEADKIPDNVVRFAKIGLTADDESGEEISSVFMLRTANAMPEVGVKLGSAISYIDGKTINSGTLYNVMMKIDASSASNDTVAFKVWPVGTNEPLGWTYEKSLSMGGTYSKLFIHSCAETGKGVYFGDFKLEAYTGYDIDTVSGAEAAVKEYIQSTDAAAAEPTAIEWPLSNSVAEKSYNNVKKLRNNAYVSDIIIESANNRIVNMDEVEAGISVAVKVSNDAGIANEFNKNIFVASYDASGVLKEVDLVTVSEVGADTQVSGDLELTNAAGTTVKIFILSDDLTPYMNKTTVGDYIKNY